MKERNWPYLAGIIDGEGTISIGVHNKTDNDVPNVALDITAVNTDERLMKWLISHFGGRYYPRARGNEKHKSSWVWRVTGRKNKEWILLGIIPYLILKKEQAKIALEYLRFSPHERVPEKRYELAQRCQALNKKGPSTPTTNTQDDSENESKIESELHSDMQSATVVTQIA